MAVTEPPPRTGRTPGSGSVSGGGSRPPRVRPGDPQPLTVEDEVGAGVGHDAELGGVGHVAGPHARDRPAAGRRVFRVVHAPSLTRTTDNRSSRAVSTKW